MPEIAVIIVVALLVLGPKRLPEVARALGKGLAEFRRVTGEVNKELQTAKDLIATEAREHETPRRTRERERIQRERILGQQPAAANPAGGSTAADPAAPDATSAGETAATASTGSSIENPTPVARDTSAKA
jgi:sec-independent protein translocase protein TatB